MLVVVSLGPFFIECIVGMQSASPARARVVQMCLNCLNSWITRCQADDQHDWSASRLKATGADFMLRHLPDIYNVVTDTIGHLLQPAMWSPSSSLSSSSSSSSLSSSSGLRCKRELRTCVQLALQLLDGVKLMSIGEEVIKTCRLVEYILLWMSATDIPAPVVCILAQCIKVMSWGDPFIRDIMRSRGMDIFVQQMQRQLKQIITDSAAYLAVQDNVAALLTNEPSNVELLNQHNYHKNRQLLVCHILLSFTEDLEHGPDLGNMFMLQSEVATQTEEATTSQKSAEKLSPLSNCFLLILGNIKQVGIGIVSRAAFILVESLQRHSDHMIFVVCLPSFSHTLFV